MAAADILSNVKLNDGPQAQTNLAANFKKSEDPPASQVPFDPVALKERYIAERDKRLKHGGGITQYNIIDEDGPFAHFLPDPWVKPGFMRDAVNEEVDVAIVGGGYCAQLVAVRLLEAGIKNIRMIEKAGDFGGTWYWNRYPGAQCDIESYIYLPLLEETNYVPREKYTRVDEMLAHAQRHVMVALPKLIGRTFGLYDKMLFQTEVHSLRWRDDQGRWSIQTSRGDNIRARFIIPSAGPLHRPKLPGVKGIEDFRGHSFHSSRWDYGYTGGDSKSRNLSNLADKRVGILGTGATAVQIVPNVANYAKETYVFQRTPSAINFRGNTPTDPKWEASLQKGWQRERMVNFDNLVNGRSMPQDLVKDKWTDLLFELLGGGTSKQIDDPEKAAAERQMLDFVKMEEVRARCDEIIKDKETAASLKPWYNVLCKRPCFHDEYLQAFNQDNVHLVDTKGAGIDRISEKGIVADGKEYELDLIIYATGFELATEWTHRSNMELYGREGKTFTECWKNGPRTYHGWTVRDFPNCFLTGVVQATLTPNFLHASDVQAKHLAYVINKCMQEGIRTVEPTADAEQEWINTILSFVMLRAPFFAECTPGYYNNEGTPSMKAAQGAAYGGGSPAFFKILDDWKAKDDFEGLDVRHFEN